MKNVSSLLLICTLILCASFSAGPITSMPATIDGTSPGALSVGGAYLVFAKKYGGEVTKKQLEGQCELGVDGCARGSRIFTFTLEVTHAGKTTSYSANKSNALSTEMLASLNALKVGDTFYFKKIQAYLPNGKDVVEVHSREFVVV